MCLHPIFQNSPKFQMKGFHNLAVFHSLMANHGHRASHTRTSPLAGTSPYLINALHVYLMYNFCLNVLYHIVFTNYVSPSYFPEQSQVPDEGLSQLSSVPQCCHGQPRTQSLTHTHKPTCWYKSLFD